MPNKPQQNIQSNAQPNDLRVPFHKHTGIDSPTISYANIIGAPKGAVYSGSMNGGVFQLPTGWTGTVVSTGYIQIDHTLGTGNYNIIIGSNGINGTHYQITGITSAQFWFYIYVHDFASNSLVLATDDFQFIINVY